MNNNLTLLATPQVGAKVDEVAAEAVRIARTLKCNIKVEFNGVTMIATDRGSPDQLVKRYEEVNSEPTGAKFIMS